MTAQVLESLHYRGREYALFGEPLNALRDARVSALRRLLRMPSTAERRGYHGTWEIGCGRLWLVGLGANVIQPDGRAEWCDDARGLAWMFPEIGPPVLANWFTGALVTPGGRGALIKGDYRWPAWRAFHVQAGHVIGVESRRGDPEGAGNDAREQFTVHVVSGR